MSKLDNNNPQGEYYLTDVLGILKSQGKKIGVYTVYDSAEIMGVNTRIRQAEAHKILNRRINFSHLENGGEPLSNPDNTYIGPYVKKDRDASYLSWKCYRRAHYHKGEGTILYPNSRIVDSVIGKGAQIQSSVILESQVGNGSTIGPFAYLNRGVAK